MQEYTWQTLKMVSPWNGLPIPDRLFWAREEEQSDE
jgi:hypothetical protein